jgi:hypothetical protein
MGAAGVDGQFITAIVKKQLQRECVFNVAGDPVVMWGALPPRDTAELASRIQNVAKVSIERVRADFPRSEMRFFLRALHMPLVQDAFKPQGRESKQEELTRCCQAALGSMRCSESDQALALLDYKALAKLLAGLAQPGQPLATKTNREIWGHCLDTFFLRGHLPDKSFTRIQNLVRFYLSIIDGSCGGERGLAKVRAYIKEHQSADIDILCDLAVAGDTNIQPGDLAKSAHGFWEAGAFGLECGALWREVLGGRMGIYNKFVNQQKLKPGTYKSVKAGVLKAPPRSRDRAGKETASDDSQQPSKGWRWGRKSPKTADASREAEGQPAAKRRRRLAATGSESNASRERDHVNVHFRRGCEPDSEIAI